MTSSTNNTGGLEVYAVSTLPGFSVGKSSLSSIIGAGRGIAIRADAPSMAVAHEIGHACWLDDIPAESLDESLISEVMAGSLNWSGGSGTDYYNSSLTHRSLVRRLLMYGKDFDASIDIPLASVKSKTTYSPYIETPFPVGLENMTRQPEH
jgi:hypothetical protein